MIMLKNLKNTLLTGLMLTVGGMSAMATTPGIATPDTAVAKTAAPQVTETNNATPAQQAAITKKDLILATSTTGIVGAFAKDFLKAAKNTFKKPSVQRAIGFAGGIAYARSPLAQRVFGNTVTFGLRNLANLCNSLANRITPPTAIQAAPKSVIATGTGWRSKLFPSKTQPPVSTPQSLENIEIKQGLTETELNKLYSLENLK